MTKIVDIRSRMIPEWIKAGKEILGGMSEENQEKIIAFIFNLVLEDVKAGLSRAEDGEIFFQTINKEFEDKEFERGHKQCYFSLEVDGNEVRFTEDTNLCLICAVKMMNVLRAHGVDIGTPQMPEGGNYGDI